MAMSDFSTGCLTCSRPSGVDYLNVQSVENTLIEVALRKHFWFTQADFKLATICLSCWNQVLNFHKFYVSVEELFHSRASVVVKADLEENLQQDLMPKEEKRRSKVGPRNASADDCMAEGISVGSVEMYQDLRMELTDCMAERLPEFCIETDMKIEQTEILTVGQEHDKTDDNSDDKSESKNTAMTKKRRFTEQTSSEICQMIDAHIEVVDDEDDSVEEVVLKVSNDKLVEFKHIPVEESHYNHPPGMITQSEFKKCQIECQEDEDYIRTLVKYICAECGHASSTFSAFRMHSQQEHGTKTPFLMYRQTNYVRKLYLMQDRYHECGKKFKPKEGLEHNKAMQSLDEQIFKCERCPRTFTSKIRLKEHIVEHVYWDIQSWKCTQCEKTLTDGQGVGAHILNCWSGSSTCAICRLVLPSQFALEAHDSEGHGSFDHQISDDNLKVTEKPYLFQETSILESSTAVNGRTAETAIKKIKEESEEPLACPTFMTFVEASCLETSTVAQDNIAVTTAEQIQDEPLECSSNMAYVETNSLGTSTAVLVETAVEQIAEESDSDKFDDDQADEDHQDSKYASRERKEHSNDSESPLKMQRMQEDEVIREHIQISCNQCGLGFISFLELKEHARVTHSNMSPYVVCCGKRFTRRNILLFHVRLTNNPKAFRCDECNKNYRSYDGMQRHNKMCHKDRTFKCDRCPNSFSSAAHLEFHMQTHPKVPAEETWKCTPCMKTYGSSLFLSRHIGRMHPDWPDYKCTICSKVFHLEVLLNKHTRRHKSVQCPRCSLMLRSRKCLSNHARVMHPNAKLCLKCIQIFPTEAALQTHTIEKHSVRLGKRKSQKADDGDDSEEGDLSECSDKKTNDVEGIDTKNSEVDPNGLFSLVVKSETKVGEVECTEGIQPDCIHKS